MLCKPLSYGEVPITEKLIPGLKHWPANNEQTDLPDPYFELPQETALLMLHCGTHDMTHLARRYSQINGDPRWWTQLYYIFPYYTVCVATHHTTDDKARGKHGYWIPTHPSFIQGRTYGRLVRYFQIGCPHDHKRELGQRECWSLDITHYGSCYHVWKCDDCGHIEAFDSSG